MQYRSFHGWRLAAWRRIPGSAVLTFLQGRLTNDLRSQSAEGGHHGSATAKRAGWLAVERKIPRTEAFP